jgi:hypothetical protein
MGRGAALEYVSRATKFFVISGDTKYEVVFDGLIISRLKMTVPRCHV